MPGVLANVWARPRTAWFLFCDGNGQVLVL